MRTSLGADRTPTAAVNYMRRASPSRALEAGDQSVLLSEMAPELPNSQGCSVMGGT